MWSASEREPRLPGCERVARPPAGRSRRANTGRARELPGRRREDRSDGMEPQEHKLELELGGQTLTISTGKMAKLAAGSAVVRLGDTVVLVAAAAAKTPTPNRDFVPLTVDYRERTYAAGKIPGGFFKREGRPTEKEVLSSRQIDRPIRPLFSKQFPYETQIMATVMSSDQENDADVLALIGASAAICLSDIPFPEPIAAVRVGRVDGQLVVNPTFGQLDESDMDIVVAGTAENIVREELRGMVLHEGIRADGRGLTDIRAVTVEVGALPRTHGSCLFTRGETQALAAATLGTKSDEQRVEELEGQSWKSYMLHYNFPPFSVGEVRPIRGPGRREIGHGALAERAIEPVIPSEGNFPYTIRIVSDILESNGSSSMATVCAGSMALMDAGVPIKAPVAGIAMGLIKEGDGIAVLTDILGVEDHLGDMDFKVTGTREGVQAFQMDTKIGGISFEVLSDALARATRGRMHILDIMGRSLAAPRTEMSPYAPRIFIMQIHPDKIREVIGPGGKIIKRLTEETGTQIDIEDSGEVRIAAVNGEGGRRAEEMIRNITEDPEPGRVYQGKVRSVVTFGAFVEIVPGRDGLLHISEIDHHRVGRTEDVLNVGDMVMVKVIGVDRDGKIKLSRKALLPEPEGGVPAGAGGGGRNHRDRDRGRRG